MRFGRALLVCMLTVITSGFFVPGAGAGDVPDVMTISCVGRNTVVDTTTIAPQDDGFHFAIDKAGSATVIGFSRPSGRGYGGFEFGTAPTEVAYPAAPNAFMIRCLRSFSDAKPGDAVAVDLVDPKGVFHRSKLECATQRAGATGPLSDPSESPEEAILRLVPGIAEGDVAEYTKYPEPRMSVYRVVRGEKIIARVGVSRWPPDDDDAPWSISGEACRSSGLTKLG